MLKLFRMKRKLYAARGALNRLPRKASRVPISSGSTSPFSSSASNCARIPNVAVSFDIDGVVLRGKAMLPQARESLVRLVNAGVPFVFLTNGGGEREWKKAKALSDIVGLPIHPEQVILSHTPLKPEIQKFANQKILVLGCREVMDVARSYGATKPVDVPMLAHDDPYRYPFIHYERRPMSPPEFREEPFAAVFQLHDPNSWGADIQVAMDVLRGGWPLGSGGDRQAVPFYLSNNDLTFAGVYPVPRLAAGAFTRALSLLFREVTGNDLTVTQCGKPTRMTFDFAARHVARWAVLERQLDHWAGLPSDVAPSWAGNTPPPHRGVPISEQSAAVGALQPPSAEQLPRFDHIFHVGDNPSADVRGANAAGGPWRSILVRTGVFKGGPGENDGVDPAHHVCEGVGQAVDHVLAHLQLR